MTQAVRETSLEVYHKLKEYFGEQALKIYEYIDTHPNITRNEIHMEIGIKEASICGRVKELLEQGLINEGVQRKDFYSKNTAYTLYTKKSIDWNLLDIYKNQKRTTNKINLPYEYAVTIYKLADYFIKHNPEVINKGLDFEEQEIIRVLKIKKTCEGIYNKYN